MQKILAFSQVIVFTILGSVLFNYSTAQNCAIPHLVSLPLDESVQTECVTTGTILANFDTANIKAFKNVISTPPNFIRVELSNNGTLSTLSLIVDTPLFQSTYTENNNKTYIDETWSQTVETQVELECNDGRSKNVLFIIPIVDKNSQAPFFERTNYSLAMGPCYNGTYESYCPLNFELPILMFDADRDLINQESNFTTNEPHFIRVSSSIVEIKSKDISSNHLIRTVRVYLKESNNFKVGDTFEFTLYGYNEELSPSQCRLSANTSITIHFGPVSGGDNSTIVLKPPHFASPIYHAVVDNLFEAIPGAELRVKPYQISAYDKSINSTDPLGYGDDGYGPNPGGGDNGKLKVRYELQANINDLFRLRIDRITGKLYFNQNITVLSTPAEHLYEVIAFYDTYEFLPAKVPLLVFFSLANGTTSDPPVCTTPSIPVCPELPTTGTPCGEPTTPHGGITNGTTETPSSGTTERTTEVFTTVQPETTTTTESIVTESPVPEITTLQPPITSSLGTARPTIPFTTTINASTSTEANTHPPTTMYPTVTPITTMNTTNTPITRTTPITTTTPSSTVTTPITTTTPSSTVTTPITTTTPSSTVTTPSTTTTTTTVTTPTTTAHVTTNPTTWFTTFITSTRPTTTTPVYDECCDLCHIVEDFECPPNIPDPNILFPDPHSCQFFYKCHVDEDTMIPIQYQCDNGQQIFCPNLQRCVSPAECDCTDFPPNERCNGTEPPNHCENCSCYRGTDPKNICNVFEGEIPWNKQIPDPKYFDIFHVCTDEASDVPGFRDCVMPCASGTFYCPHLGQCRTALDEGCDKGDKIPYKCNPCFAYYLSRGVQLRYGSEYSSFNL